ncbi:MAG TPA: Uma2 family endonuclease [Planctomycetota bacterium]|jgi:Uma2 family endonuclease
MANPTSTSTNPAQPVPQPRSRRRIPELENGDHLTRAEFERRYAAMPQIKKAELIEGEVCMPSPVSLEHSDYHSNLDTVLNTYRLQTPGVRKGLDATVRLDDDNEPQPDLMLYILPNSGGQARSAETYLDGAPELIVEIAGSSASRDLHKKMNVYRRNGVKEYIVCRVLDDALDWFVLREGVYETLKPGSDGRLRSEVFPGLWLDPAALLKDDMKTVLGVLNEGLASPEHAAFVKRLEDAAKES